MIVKRKWEKSDNIEIESLEKLCFKSPWNISMLDSCFETQNFYGLVIETDKKIVGYIGCAFDSWDVDILNICVDKKYRRKGFATELFKSVIEHFKNEHKEKMFLEVRVSNTPAINLYTGLGFKQIGLREKYYENTEDAIVMVLEL